MLKGTVNVNSQKRIGMFNSQRNTLNLYMINNYKEIKIEYSKLF